MIRSIAGLMLSASAVFGQDAPPPMAFDVASVKVSQIGKAGGKAAAGSGSMPSRGA